MLAQADIVLRFDRLVGFSGEAFDQRRDGDQRGWIAHCCGGGGVVVSAAWMAAVTGAVRSEQLWVGLDGLGNYSVIEVSSG